MLREHARLDGFCGIAERHAARLDDLAEDAERDVALALLVPAELAVARERPQGVEVRHAGLGVLGRDRAAADVVAQIDDRLADPEVTLDPTVLLVRLAIVHLEEHAEPAA